MKEMREGNKTMYYSDDILMLTIEKLSDTIFTVENRSFKMTGECYNIDEYTTSVYLTKYQSIGENGRYYKTKKLLEHNTSWFAYILKEKGFVEKTKPTN